MKDISAYSKQKGGLGGRRARCRKCINTGVKEDRKKNPKKYNSEQRIEYRKEYFTEYYLKHAEVIKDRSAEHYYMRRGNEDFRRRRAENKKEWAQKNPHMITLQNHRRMARKRELPHNFTESDMAKTLERFGGKCALTGMDCELHWDHVIPLTTGHGGTTPWNMLPISATLNVSKGNRHILEWFEDNKRYYNLSETLLYEALDYLSDLKSVTPKELIEHMDWCFENKEEEI